MTEHGSDDSRAQIRDIAKGETAREARARSDLGKSAERERVHESVEQTLQAEWQLRSARSVN